MDMYDVYHFITLDQILDLYSGVDPSNITICGRKDGIMQTIQVDVHVEVQHQLPIECIKELMSKFKCIQDANVLHLKTDNSFPVIVSLINGKVVSNNKDMVETVSNIVNSYGF